MVITETDSRGVATVTLNNADKHNAFDDQLIAQISATFDALEADLGVRIVILQAAGRSFSAGADLAWMRRMADYSYEENHRDATLMAAMFRRINTLSKPTIARVHGVQHDLHGRRRDGRLLTLHASGLLRLLYHPYTVWLSLGGYN